MSTVDLKDAAGATFHTKTHDVPDGVASVKAQGVVQTDPTSGDPVDVATEATLLALNVAIGTLNAAAAAIQSAVVSINGKTTAVNTGAIAGTVELGATSLAALETISINGTVPVSGPLTDAQIRSTALPISAAALPLPSGAASESTLTAVNSKLPTLSGGRVPVELPAGGGGLTDAELRATPVPVAGSFSALPDDTATLMACLRALVHPIWEDVSSGRLRVVLDPLGGAQTLGTVTTVGTVTTCSTVTAVTTLNKIASISAASLIYDQMHAAWAQAVRPRIT